MKPNCWEYKNCGREPQGRHLSDQGLCPAAVETRLDGVHGGKNGGRACWVIAGTLCGGEVQGTFGSKYKNCGLCDFYNRTRYEEKQEFKLSITLLKILRSREGCRV